MKVECTTGIDGFHVRGWQTTTPETVINVLKKQLAAAQAVWPDLKRWSLVAEDPEPELAGDD